MHVLHPLLILLPKASHPIEMICAALMLCWMPLTCPTNTEIELCPFKLNLQLNVQKSPSLNGQIVDWTCKAFFCPFNYEVCPFNQIFNSVLFLYLRDVHDFPSLQISLQKYFSSLLPLWRQHEWRKEKVWASPWWEIMVAFTQRKLV